MINTARTDIKLLLACLATGDLLERYDRLRAIIAEGVDWDQFRTLVVQHEVAPVVYKALRDANISDIPASYLSNLRTQFHQAGLESYRLLEALLAILDMLHANQIVAVSYKGPVLSALLYDNPAMRTCQDIDIVVRASDVQLALQLLQQHGYRLVESEIGPDENHHQPLVHAKSGLMVEIHWNIVSLKHGYKLSTEEFWQRVEPITINGKHILTFGPDDMLLLLCVHGTKHYWRSVKWILDIARLVEVCDINWLFVEGEARRLHIEDQLAFGLLVAQRFLGAPLPSDVTSHQRRKLILRWLAGFHEGQLVGRSELYPYIEGGITEWVVHRSPKTGWRLIRRFFHRRLQPNEQDQATLNLHGPFRILYILFRPMRLFIAYGLGRYISSKGTASHKM